MLLTTDSVSSLKVHPVVVFQILDRYLRRIEGHEKVIGTLLGTVENGVVEVTNSFPVPYLEKGDEVAVGKDFHKQMYSLHQMVNPKEVVVGWYGTSPNGVSISEHSCLIHDFYGSECAFPVHIVLDTCLKDEEVSVKGFISTPLELAGVALENQFKQIPTEIESTEAETIALDFMSHACNQVNYEDTKMSNIKQLPSELESLEKSIDHLYGMIEETFHYVTDVINGKQSADASIGREIADALDAIPHIKPEIFHRVFNNSLQDLLMVAYLASMTQAQLCLTEKLSEKMP